MNGVVCEWEEPEVRLVKKLRSHAKHLSDIGGNENAVAMLQEAADWIEEEAKGATASLVRFELPTPLQPFKWEPQRWWDMPRVSELVNLPPHHPKAYVNTDGKVLYRVVQVEYVRDGEVIIRVEGPLNG